MVKILKLISIIVYCLITLPDAHYKLNFIGLLMIATIKGNVFTEIASLLIWTSILLLIWTVIKPKRERDRVLVPIIALVLNIPIVVIMFNGLFHPAYFNHKDFLIPAMLFFILTIIYTILTFRIETVD